MSLPSFKLAIFSTQVLYILTSIFVFLFHIFPEVTVIPREKEFTSWWPLFFLLSAFYNLCKKCYLCLKPLMTFHFNPPSSFGHVNMFTG